MIKKPLFCLTAAIIFIAAFCLAGCKPASQAALVEFTVTDNKKLSVVELSYNGVVYRPYGVVPDNSLRGKQIGTRKDEPQSKICEVKGYPSNEWIIDYLDVFMGGGDMIFKAVGVSEVPAEIEQYKEYDN